jgi:RNA-directed DNA polymerase
MVNLSLSNSPDKFSSEFKALETPQDVADLLEIGLERLYYHIYIISDSKKYTIFNVSKKTGGVRTISAPITALKIIQQKFNRVLLQVYSPKPCVHSFIHDRSIVSNATKHLERKSVLNIDLEDFFPSINFGRVRGLFMGKPYNLCAPVSTILAQICCFNNQLPQGAPTSPIITNMICAQLDSQLMALAKSNRCDYTRYADDMTFSTNIRDFPTALAVLNSIGQIEVGGELRHIIEQNGFKINSNKTRLRGRNQHQQVTGITVNKFTNVKRKLIRQIRAMLHAWEKFGFEAAQSEFYKQYDKKFRSQWKTNPNFGRVVKGKIEYLGMVRGKNDPIYVNLCNRLKNLAPELVKDLKSITPQNERILSAVVFTEGKSDWTHLMCALTSLKALGKYTFLRLEFNSYSDNLGDTELLKLCASYSRVNRDKPNIFMFDRDNPKIIAEVTGEDKQAYKPWGNNVYSFAIPIPLQRKDKQNVSIEFYYSDEEIKQLDKNGRRLFLSNEFYRKSGRHIKEDLTCHQLNKIQSSDVSIIDNDVLTPDGRNVALSKYEFSTNVINKVPGFNNFNFTEFSNIFDIIQRILETCNT